MFEVAGQLQSLCFSYRIEVAVHHAGNGEDHHQPMIIVSKMCDVKQSKEIADSCDCSYFYRLQTVEFLRGYTMNIAKIINRDLQSVSVKCIHFVVLWLEYRLKLSSRIYSSFQGVLTQMIK